MKTTMALLESNQFGQARVVPISVVNDDTAEHQVELLTAEVDKLKTSLEYEKKLRMQAENKIEELTLQIQELKLNKRTRRTKKQIQEDIATKEYSELKSNGLRKAQAAEPIRSYDDFVAIQNYFLSKNKVRDWMLWTIGVSLGLRISDLLKLKIKYFLNNDLTFKKRITIIEQKTDKINDCLITESVVMALAKYFDSIQWKFNLDDYLFKSQKTGTKMEEKHGWKIISSAGKALKIPLNIGSHTMRKSFANIAACVDKNSIDMNAITKIQGLLNHSDQRVTMRYLGTFRDMYDKARQAVSDFVLGKTTINELVAGNTHTVDDLFTKLDALETKFFDNELIGGTNEQRNN